MEGERIIYRLENEKFKETPFKELKIGDKFKIIDTGDQPFETGNKVYKALDNPYKNKDGIESILVDNVEELV